MSNQFKLFDFFLRLNYFVATIAFWILIPLLTSAQQAGDLDLSFDGDGKVSTAIGTETDRYHCIAIQPDQKIVVGGQSYLAGDARSLVSRYLPDGTIDSSFGTNGHRIINLQVGFQDLVLAIIIQNDGKILAASGKSYGTSGKSAAFRLNSDGSIDTSFASVGYKTYLSLPGSNSPSKILTDQFDRKYITGYTDNSMYAMRIKTNGLEDSTYSGDGLAIPVTPFTNTQSHGSRIQADMKIILVGSANNSLNFNPMIARLDTTGNLDSGYGANGLSLLNCPGINSFDDCVLQPDGKAVAVGWWSGSGSDNDIIVARYLNNGNLDSTFSGDGYDTVVVGMGMDRLQSVAIQSDGKIIAAGVSENIFGLLDFLLVRYDTAGNLDPTFGTNGVILTDFDNDHDVAAGMLIQQDHKIVACGGAIDNGKWNGALARYHSGLFSSLEEPEIKNELVIYPNPAGDQFFIRIQSEYNSKPKIRVIDAFGKDVSLPVKSTTGYVREFDCSQLSNGIYFVFTEGKKAGKLVINH